MRRTWLLLVAWLGLCLAIGAAGNERPAIAAAADLKFALTEVANQFTADSAETVRISFGSSGMFRAQIEQGARFELFLSADEALIAALHRSGLTRDEGVVYGEGRLVLFCPVDSRLRAASGLVDLAAAVDDGRVRRFAIANPDHAPYGRAARAVLEHLGVWSALQGRLVYGENAAQATQFAAAGGVDGGLVPLAMAIAPEVAARGAYIAVPPAWHATAPLRQRMALLRGAGPTATAFYRYLQAPTARRILDRYGFRLPPAASE